MKKLISIVLALTMLLSFGVVAFPASAEETAPEAKVLTMYIADSGSDANDGLTPATPKKTFNALLTVMNPKARNEGYTEGVIKLVGNSSVLVDPALYNLAWPYPMTITSEGTEKHAILISTPFRMGGETLFTNIKLIMKKTGGPAVACLSADGHKLTIGKEGVENDVITYDTAAGSAAPLILTAGSGSGRVLHDKNEMIINCGTYSAIHTGSLAWMQTVGTVDVIINNATVTDGVITLGPTFTPGTTAFVHVDQFFESTGAYNVTINGGTYTNTDIIIGPDGTLNGSKLDRHTNFGEKVTLDINGGTFDAACHIGTGRNVITAENYPDINFDPATWGTTTFKKGFEINYAGLKNDQKAAIDAMIPEADKTSVVAHESSYKYADATNHTVGCHCGCGDIQNEAHTWDAGVVTTPATHTQPGEKSFTCEKCEGTKTEVINADPNMHDYANGWVKVDDATHKKVCADTACPDANKGTVTENHTWNEGEVTKIATHTEEGEKTFACTGCGATKVEKVAKTTNHSYSTTWEKHDDAQHKRVCACGDAKYGDHDFDDGKITKEATENEDGEKTFTCKSCGAAKVEKIEKLAKETKTTPADDSKGCASVIGSAIVVLPMILGAAVIVRKKKED